MSAGYIQLAAIGQQDAYLTGEPEVTYFSGVYRRHTPFVLEAYEIPFLEQQVRYGDNNICRIPPKGDLVRGLTLKMTLPPLRQSGEDWYWPTIPSSSNAAQIVINGLTLLKAPFVGVDYYSTFNPESWLNGTGVQGVFTSYIAYDRPSNKFVFTGCTSVWVLDVRGAGTGPSFTNTGVFWGLDPKAANGTGTYNGTKYLVYDVGANARTSDFNLEQAGWVRNPSTGMPDPPTRSGLFLQTVQNVPAVVSTSLSYLNLAAASATGPYWTQWDADSSFKVTPGGRISITSSGLYVMRVGFGLNGGSVSNVAWGSSLGDGEPTVLDFKYTYPWRVSPNPSAPAILPMNITTQGSNVFVYASGTGGTLVPGSYISINAADDLYVLSSDVTMIRSNIVPFYANVVTTGSAATTILADGVFRINRTGSYVVTGVLAMEAGYVSNVIVLEGTTPVYTYDMSSQGRDPTFAFGLPIVVTDVSRDYRINVGTSTGGTAKLLANSYFVFNQVAIPASPVSPGPGVVLPYNGLMFQASTIGTQVPASPLRLSDDFASNGYQYVETLSGNAIQFSNTGTYVLTGALSLGLSPSGVPEQLRSVSINVQGSVTTYPVGLGLAPPYTINVPFRVSNILASSTTVSLVTASGARPNLLSTTFFSVYPIASNANPQISYSYYDSVATLAIERAELKVGGQLIESLTGEAIEIWNDLRVSSENQPGLALLTGKGDASQAYSSRSYYVNLPFYFFESPELSLPIVSVSRQDIEVHVAFKNFSNLTAVTSVVNPTLVATIVTEYVYLSEPEINWFRSSRIEHVITQYQYQTFTLPANFTSGVFKLDFKNPIREMYLVIQPITNISWDYSNNGFKDMSLKFNSQDALTADATQLGTIEPFRKYKTFPTRDFYVYSFAAEPTSPKPTGHVNFSRMNEVLLTVNTDAYYTARKLRIMAIGYNVLRIENGLAGLMFN